MPGQFLLSVVLDVQTAKKLEVGLAHGALDGEPTYLDAAAGKELHDALQAAIQNFEHPVPPPELITSFE